MFLIKCLPTLDKKYCEFVVVNLKIYRKSLFTCDFCLTREVKLSIYEKTKQKRKLIFYGS